MKLVTFQVKNPIGIFNRIGCLSCNCIIDLNSAYASYLHYERSEEDIYTLANASIPSDMVQFLHLGSTSNKASKMGKEFVERGLRRNEQLEGPKSKQITYRKDEIRLLAPIPRPKLIRDFMGFEKHLETALRNVAKQSRRYGMRFRHITRAIQILLRDLMIQYFGPVIQRN